MTLGISRRPCEISQESVKESKVFTKETTMKKILALSVFCLLAFCSILQAGDIVGYWKSIDDKTGKAQSIVGIYEYQGKYYGRIIATFNDEGVVDDTIYTPKDKAPGVVGDPYYAGLDIIYDLKKDDSRYNGKIMDPEEGKVYNATLWTEGQNLVVRGEIWLFEETRHGCQSAARTSHPALKRLTLQNWYLPSKK